ncbi:hypothetical protein BE21_43940 [Sorangium cellulosum]|uniref:HTH iclR-type domain-containing protein n=1 Tax=Sorangium cellulosum TaxID=56 RepID=A0A150TJR7_SORCE|nr:hypothetical protein BE21_43940 [Sorangium cellulosum]
MELGVIEALPATAADVAARWGLPEERARRSLRTLGELGIIEGAVDGRSAELPRSPPSRARRSSPSSRVEA